MAEVATSIPASFDWLTFGRECRLGFNASGEGLRALAGKIGVSVASLSRASGGTNVSIDTVMAICDFLGTSERRYYKSPMKSDCFTGTNVKHTKTDAQ